MAAGDSVYLGEEDSDVVVEATMADPAIHTITNNGSLIDKGGACDGKSEGPAVILAVGDIFSVALKGIESLRAEAARDISIKQVVANSEVDLYAGRNINVPEGVEVGDSCRDQARIWIESTGGDVDTGYLYAKARSDASVTVIAAGDLTISGNAAFDAVSAYANNVPNADSANANICIEGGRSVTINNGIEAKAQGKHDSSGATIHIIGGATGTKEQPMISSSMRLMVSSRPGRRRRVTPLTDTVS